MNQVEFHHGEFSLVRRADGDLRWKGTFERKKVLAAFLINGGENCLVHLDWADQDPFFQNLVCLDRNGFVVWRGELIRPHADTFTNVQVRESEIKATTWSSYAVTLDPQNGKILRKTFTK